LLLEVLAEPAVVSRLSDTKAAGEVRALDTFYAMLQSEPDRAFYGYDLISFKTKSVNL